MEFKNEDLKVRFTVPDKPNVRQQLQYWGAVASLGEEDLFLALWRGAKTLIQEWHCETMKKLDEDLDKTTELKQTEVIMWVGMRVREFVISLENVPKK